MGYTSGAKTIYDLLEEIVAALLASSGGYWSDGDTTWTTSNKTMANLGRRCLKYTNGSETIYWAFEVINQTSGAYFWSGQYAKGLVITASATWDAVNHTYPVSNNSSFITMQSHGGGVGSDIAILQFTYYLWVESNGFTLMCKPEPTGENSQTSTFLVIERNANKEYSDGYSNFYLMYVNNIWGCLYGGGSDIATNSIFCSRTILRPFAYQYPIASSRVQCSPNANGISFVANPSYYAFKSTGNGGHLVSCWFILFI